MANPATRIRAVRLYFVGVLSAAIVLIPLILLVTIGKALADPYNRPILIFIGVIGAVGTVALELKARIAHVTVADGRLRWRTVDSWRPGDQPIESIGRVEIMPKGDVGIYFNDNRKNLDLSAREFRRDDLTRLIQALSAAAGRDLTSQHGPGR